MYKHPQTGSIKPSIHSPLQCCFFAESAIALTLALSLQADRWLEVTFLNSLLY